MTKLLLYSNVLAWFQMVIDKYAWSICYKDVSLLK